MQILKRKSALLLFAAACFSFAACDQGPSTTGNSYNPMQISAAQGTPELDGSGSDDAWDNTPWHPLQYSWMDNTPDTTDFQGRFKVLWDNNMLYVLVEIEDDTLIDVHADGLAEYHHDDCLEIFLDEDASGGEHGYNHSAFAYHIALDNKVVDIAPDSSARYYNDHCVSIRSTAGRISVWEVGLKVYDGNKYLDEGGENIAKSIAAGKVIGFAVAYCDNDRSPEREHFMGSVPIEGANKNEAWHNASVLAKLELK